MYDGQRHIIKLVFDCVLLLKMGKMQPVSPVERVRDCEKDSINEETVELMSPYLNLPNFEPKVARNASRVCEGLCTWVRAMI